MLLAKGIDPYFGIENLAFAPNDGGHLGLPLIEIHRQIKEAFDDGYGLNRLQRLLASLATDYILRRLPGMKL